MTFTPTHCRPVEPYSGMLDPPAFPGGTPVNYPAGKLRGLVVLLHGIDDFAPTPPNQPFGDDWADLSTKLLADNWATIYPQQCGDLVGQENQTDAMLADIGADPSGTAAHWGAIVLAWWDHVRDWADYHYGPRFPLVPIGFSNGGWTALEIAVHRPETMVGWIAHHPAISWNTIFDTTIMGSIDIASTALNTCTVPGLLSWGTADDSVDPLHNYDSFSDALYTAAHGAGAPVSASVDDTGTYKSPTTRTTSVTTTEGSNVITGTFTSADVNQSILGTGIGNNAILSQTGSSATMLSPATASGTVTATISVGGIIHIFTSAATTQFMDWLTAQVDPNCPSTF